MKTTPSRVCPICGREYNDYPAISRSDDHTEICSRCGIIEALQAADLDENTIDEILDQIDSLDRRYAPPPTD